MKTILLKNGQILNATGALVPQDLLIRGEQIEQMAPEIEAIADEVIDLQKKFISPGLIDMHVHLREPGFEEKETLETGSKAAARGGFTTIACMPNTRPPLDHLSLIQELLKKAEQLAITRILPIPAMTMGMKGETLTDFRAFKKAGLLGVTDDGYGVQHEDVMRAAFYLARECSIILMQHCEFCDLSNGGVFHEGPIAQLKGVKGISSASEFKMIERDLVLVRETGVHYHVLHVSTAESVALIRQAKKEGLPVTAEVTPHHLLLCDEDIPGVDTNFKMNPPLRSYQDRLTVLQGLRDGTIDIIATDHAPHTESEKERNVYEAPFGIVGLETAFPLLYTHLVLKKLMSLKELLAKITTAPARIFNLPYGTLEPKGIADITVIDLEQERPVNPRTFLSKSKNTPFQSWRLRGWPVMTFHRGRKVWG